MAVNYRPGVKMPSQRPPGGGSMQQTLTPIPARERTPYTVRPQNLAPGYVMGPDGRPVWVGEREAARQRGGGPGFGGSNVPGSAGIGGGGGGGTDVGAWLKSIMGGGGGGPIGGAGIGEAGGTTISAQADPRLEALQKRYTDWLTQYEQGTGHASEVAGQRAQEALMGGRKMMEERSALTGRPIDETRYAAEVARAGAGGAAAEALRREETLGQAISGGLPLAGSVGEAQRAEKGLGLQARGQDIQARQAEAQIAQSRLDQFLRLLQAMGGF